MKFRDLKEIDKDLQDIEIQINNAWKEGKEREDKGEKWGSCYETFHQLCRKKEDLEFERNATERYNVKVGDGVTVCYYTDMHAGTVIARTKNSITIQQDKATLKDGWKPEFIPGGFAGHCINQDTQEYDYERDENGRIWKAYWSNVKGKFVADKHLNVYNGRTEFYDYNF